MDPQSFLTTLISLLRLTNYVEEEEDTKDVSVSACRSPLFLFLFNPHPYILCVLSKGNQSQERKERHISRSVQTFPNVLLCHLHRYRIFKEVHNHILLDGIPCNCVHIKLGWGRPRSHTTELLNFLLMNITLGDRAFLSLTHKIIEMLILIPLKVLIVGTCVP